MYLHCFDSIGRVVRATTLLLVVSLVFWGCTNPGPEPEEAEFRVVVENLDINISLSFAFISGQTYTFFTEGEIAGASTEIIVGVLDDRNQLVAATQVILDNTVTQPPTGATEGGGFIQQVLTNSGPQMFTVPFDWYGTGPGSVIGVTLGFGAMPGIISHLVNPSPVAVAGDEILTTGVLAGTQPDWVGLTVTSLIGTPDVGDLQATMSLHPEADVFVGRQNGPAVPGLATVRLLVENNSGGISTHAQVIGFLPTSGAWSTLQPDERIAYLAALPWHALDGEVSQFDLDFNSDGDTDSAFDLNDDGDVDRVDYKDRFGAVESTLRVASGPVFNMVSLTGDFAGYDRVLRDYGFDDVFDEQWVDSNRNGFPEPSEVTPLTSVITYSIPTGLNFPPPSGTSVVAPPVANQRPVLTFPADFVTHNGIELSFTGANTVSVHEPQFQEVLFTISGPACGEFVEPPLTPGVLLVNSFNGQREARTFSGSAADVSAYLAVMGWHRGYCTGYQELDLSVRENTGSSTAVTGASPVTYTPNQVPNYLTPTVTTDSATPISILVDSIATDPEGEPLEITLVGGQGFSNLPGLTHTNTTIEFDPTGNYDYLPRGTIESVEISVRVWDRYSQTVGTVTIDVTGLNHAPEANPDTFTVAEDDLLQVAGPGVLDNDTDLENDPRTAQLETNVSVGTLTLNADGGFEYSQNGAFNYLRPNEIGWDEFWYRAAENPNQVGGGTVSAPARVAIRVVGVDNPLVLAPVGGFTVVEDDPAGIDVPLSATDPEGEDIYFRLDNAPPWMWARDFGGGTAALRGRPTENSHVGITTVQICARNSPNGYVANRFACEDITVTVLNNNEPPDLDAWSVNRGPIPENTPLGSDLGTITVTDGDPGDSWTFDISSGNTGNAFRLDSISATSARLVVDNPLDFETTTRYDLEFTVADSGGLTDRSTTWVDISNVSDEVPVISGVTANVPEDRGDAWGIDSQDLEGDPLSYTLVTPAQNGTVTIGQGGSFYVLYRPDPDYNGPDSFVIRANDGMFDSNDATYDITVDPEQDAPVAYDITGVSTLEETPIDITLDGFDIDNDPLSYRITTQPFRIFGASVAPGTVTVSGDVATYTPGTNFDGQIEFRYVANDGIDDSNIATVTVDVTNVNDPPVFSQSSYDFTIDENSDPNVSVGTVSATDPDGWGIRSYEIPATDPAFPLFELDRFGAITPKAGAVLDFEGPGGPDITFTVEAVDAGWARGSTTVIVHLADVDERPELLVPGPFTLAENSPSGTVVASNMFRDPEGQALTYSFYTYSNNVSGYRAPLEVDSNGNIVVASAAYLAANPTFSPFLDFETTPNIVMRVIATDPSNLWNGPFFDINLTDENEAPYLVNPGPFNIDENHMLGALVTTLDVVDPEGGSPTASIVPGVGSASLFGLSGFDLTVMPPTILNFENVSSHSLSIELDDGQGITTIVSITIDVNNRTDPIVFGQNPFTFNLPENSSTGTAVGQVQATSEDGPVTYREWGINQYFDIDSNGNITTTSRRFDYEQTTTSSFEVEARSPRGAERQFVVIDIVDVNEPPTLSVSGLSSASVPENSANGFSLGSVSVTDVDQTDSWTFDIATGNTGNAFRMDLLTATTAELVVNGPLDYDTLPVYNLEIRVTDRGGLESVRTHRVILSDIIDEPPVLDVSNLNSGPIPEDTVLGSFLGYVYVSDPDLGDSWTFDITAGNTGNAFRIDTTGLANRFRLTLNSPLDFETTPQYDLEITVTDSVGLTDVENHTVSISDVVDEPPVLDVAGLSSSPVPEDTVLGSGLGSVGVADPDSGDSWSVDITAGNTGNVFRFDPLTATTFQLVVNGTLDFETITRYDLEITVTDSIGLTDVGNHTVTISNVNDVPPVISDVTDSVPEDAGGQWSLLQQDSEGDTLQYVLVTAPANGTVTFQTLTSAPFNATDVVYVPNLNYVGPDSFVIRANDGIFDSNLATYDMTVTPVQDAPVAYNLAGITMQEDTTIDIRLSATDIDNDPLTYRITTQPVGNQYGPGGTVTVNGDVATFAPGLNFFGPAEFYYVANDGIDDSNIAKVSVDVTDRNDAPVFNPATYTFSVPENSGSTVAIGSVTATDPELLGVTYAIPATHPAFPLFQVDNQGTLRPQAGAVLDFERPAGPNIAVTVEATDILGASSSANVTVSLTNVNEAPSLASIGPFNINENHPVGAQVTVLNMVDPEGALVTATVVPGVGSASDFEIINGNTLIVRPPTVLNYELLNSHTIEIEMADPLGLTATAQITIDVNDMADPVIFNPTSYTFPLAENEPTGTGIGQVFATCEDGPVTFAIAGGAALFDVDATNGNVTNNTVFNFEQLTTQFAGATTFDIVGTSPLLATATQTVNVSVSDVNEATSGIVPIPDESVGAGAAFVRGFSLNDLDQGEVFSFSVLPAWLSVRRLGAQSNLNGSGWFLSEDQNFELFGTAPTQAGPFNVTIDVNDASGPVGTITQTIHTAAVTVSSNPTSGNAGQTVFTFSSTAFGAPTLTYEWTHAGLVLGTTPTLTHTFTAAGPQTVELRVVDGNGLAVTDSVTVSVGAPTANPLGVACAWDLGTAATGIDCDVIPPGPIPSFTSPQEVCFSIDWAAGSAAASVNQVDWTFDSNLTAPVWGGGFSSTTGVTTSTSPGGTLTNTWCLFPNFVFINGSSLEMADYFEITADVVTSTGTSTFTATYDVLNDEFYQALHPTPYDEDRQAIVTGTGLLPPSEWLNARDVNTVYLSLFDTNDAHTYASPVAHADADACNLTSNTPIDQLSSVQLGACSLAGLSNDEIRSLTGYSQVNDPAIAASGYLDVAAALGSVGTNYDLVYLDLMGPNPLDQLNRVTAALPTAASYSGYVIASDDPAVLDLANRTLPDILTVLRFGSGAAVDVNTLVNGGFFPSAFELVLPDNSSTLNPSHAQDLLIAQELFLPVVLRAINPRYTLLTEADSGVDGVLTDANWTALRTEYQAARVTYSEKWETFSIASGDFDGDGLGDWIEVGEYTSSSSSSGLFNETFFGNGFSAPLLGTQDYDLVQTVQIGGGPDDVVGLDTTGMWRLHVGTAGNGLLSNIPVFETSANVYAPSGFQTFTGTATSVDLNGDTLEDLVLGATINGEDSLIIIRGEAAGLARNSRQIVSMDDCPTPESGTGFGASLARYGDSLLVGAPTRQAGPVVGGSLFQIDGHTNFFSSGTMSCLEISNPHPTPQSFDAFGMKLVVANPDGVPNVVVGTMSAVLFSYGIDTNDNVDVSTAVDLTASNFFGPSVSCPGATYNLHAADINGDSVDDLIAGYPCHNEVIGTTTYTELGAMEIWAGSSNLGLFSHDSFVIEFGKTQLASHWSNQPLANIVESGLRYGEFIAIGDFPPGTASPSVGPPDPWELDHLGVEVSVFSRPFTNVGSVNYDRSRRLRFRWAPPF